MALHFNAKDLSGKRFGRLVAQVPVPALGKTQGVRWQCLCDCGETTSVAQGNLSTGSVQSCGCLKRERLRSYFRTHGETSGGRSDRYALWVEAKRRAKSKDMEFSISFEDIIIPELCPLLGIPLRSGRGKGIGPTDNAPSLDRINQSRGYVKGNVWVISNRANRLKSDASLEELELLARNLRFCADAWRDGGEDKWKST
jgi:hypothetical protein